MLDELGFLKKEIVTLRDRLDHAVSPILTKLEKRLEHIETEFARLAKTMFGEKKS